MSLFALELLTTSSSLLLTVRAVGLESKRSVSFYSLGSMAMRFYLAKI